ncbi:hypothetical protein A6R68_23707 [Neotoma lepida]|uniref:Uncharacterized protein n=1 Tax=Neotoma lepida TaxID=56216 RepID=A0A1A6HV21_NEOLE|nr:hypothetical protein A6R68_23707 [Neotoma lepida]
MPVSKQTLSASLFKSRNYLMRSQLRQRCLEISSLTLFHSHLGVVRPLTKASESV